MGFLRRDQGTEDEGEEVTRLREGGITDRAEERLSGSAGGRALFTSGLSVREFALLGRLGPEPVAQVMGASVVRPGWQYLPALPPGSRAGVRAPGFGGVVQTAPPPGSSGYTAIYTEPSPQQVSGYLWGVDVVCELEMLSDAWNTARRRAIDRLREEATEVGADAVIGVHLDRSDHDLGRGLIEYAVSGTAIRIPGEDPPAQPTLTDLSVQDYWRLRQGGFEPADMVAATCVTFGSPGRATRVRRARTTMRVQELAEIGEAFHAARESVRAALGDQVTRAQGSTAVGVDFAHDVHQETVELGSSLASTSRQGWHISRVGVPYRVKGGGVAKRRGWVITMHGAGTAIRQCEQAPVPPVRTTIRLGTR